MYAQLSVVVCSMFQSFSITAVRVHFKLCLSNSHCFRFWQVVRFAMGLPVDVLEINADAAVTYFSHSYIHSVGSAHCNATIFMICMLCISLLSPLVGVLHYGFGFFGHRMSWSSPRSFCDIDFRRRYQRYPTACGVAQAVSQGVFGSADID